MISKSELKNRIANFIETTQGCKAGEISSRLRDSEILMALSEHKLQTILEELVKDQKIMQVEYVVDDTDLTTKRFMLPYGSSVKVTK